ncbi:MAG: hypothetical protein SYC29_01255 [Planctomycetota bacterium]|nr:hypothetical protein [Planctomycetota bacterium]
MQLRRRWLNARHVLAVPFAAVMLFFAVARVAGPLAGSGPVSVHRYITSGILAATAVPVGYFALTGLVNVRRITLTRDGLRIVDGPLPTPRSRRFAGPAVRTVRFETESVRMMRRTIQRYRIDAQLSDGSRTWIDRIEDNEAQARFIYEQVTAFLKKR